VPWKYNGEFEATTFLRITPLPVCLRAANVYMVIFIPPHVIIYPKEIYECLLYALIWKIPSPRPFQRAHASS